MTLSSDPIAWAPSGRVARMLRGHAVEHAQPATFDAEYVEADAPSSRRHQSPAERAEVARQEAYDEGFNAGLAAARGTAEERRSESVHRAAQALGQAAAAIEA